MVSDKGLDLNEDREKRSGIKSAEERFEVKIDRGANCLNNYYYYSWHSEDKYVKFFNEVGDSILGMFSKVENGN